MKTSELTGAALDWAVAKCEGRRVESPNGSVYWPELCYFSPSTTWLQCGEIISREGITVGKSDLKEYAQIGSTWAAYKLETLFEPGFEHEHQHADDPRVAVCRCYVASKLGNNVDVPDELISA